MAKLTIGEQRAIIGERLSNTLNSTDSELRTAREQALNFYYGRPLGNEIEGRSQVVSKDMMDTIEWMMPSLMRVFCVQQAIQFDPVGPEDEELAKQETAYVTHVLWKKNPGFMILYEWLKDALIEKNGYVKYYWQEEDKICFDQYTGLTDEQLILTLNTLESEGSVDIVGKDQAEDGTWSIKVKTQKKYGCAKIECVPPSEVVVDRNCKGQIKKARFVGHLRRNVSRSELIEEGYPRKRVNKLTSYDWNADISEQIARDTVHETLNTDDKSADTASDELQLLDCWTYLDSDDDGVAELRHYLLAGNDELENEEAPEIPFDSWTAMPVSHRHSGLSIYDIMEDLQRIKTALQRGLLDNVYFTNAPRYSYSRLVDTTSLQINRPGGHALVNTDGPVAGHIEPMMVQPIADRLLPVIGYVDEVKETRTGVGRMSVGVDADVLAQSTKGAYMDAKGAANQRIEAIARIFAETGYSSLYSSLHRLLMRHQDWVTRFKLKDQWITVNPTEWQERANLTVSVGLGNSSKEEVRANLGLMGQAQMQAAQMPGLIQPDNVFSLFRRMQTELGFENENFITDPKSQQYIQFMQSQKPAPDPYIEAEKIKSQTKLQEKQIDATTEIRKQNLDASKDEADAAIRIAELEVSAHTDLAKAGIGAELKRQSGRAGAAGNSGPAVT